jgi:hypothetical protein
LPDDSLKNVKWDHAQPLPLKVARYLRANFPQITAPYADIYEPRNVKGTSVASSHAEGRALDVHLRASDPNQKLVGDQLFKALIEAAHSTGIDNVIWNRQIWSVEHGGPRPFIGHYKNGAAKNPHIDHIHIEFTRTGSQLQVFRLLELKIGQIRGGLEELAHNQKDIT